MRTEAAATMTTTPAMAQPFDTSCAPPRVRVGASTRAAAEASVTFRRTCAGSGDSAQRRLVAKQGKRHGRSVVRGDNEGGGRLEDGHLEDEHRGDEEGHVDHVHRPRRLQLPRPVQQVRAAEGGHPQQRHPPCCRRSTRARCPGDDGGGAGRVEGGGDGEGGDDAGGGGPGHHLEDGPLERPHHGPQDPLRAHQITRPRRRGLQSLHAAIVHRHEHPGDDSDPEAAGAAGGRCGGRRGDGSRQRGRRTRSHYIGQRRRPAADARMERGGCRGCARKGGTWQAPPARTRKHAAECVMSA